jgi:hypothetical protein
MRWYLTVTLTPFLTIAVSIGCGLIARKRPRLGYALATCYLSFLCYAVFGTPYFR